jgi:hypothetical protein
MRLLLDLLGNRVRNLVINLTAIAQGFFDTVGVSHLVDVLLNDWFDNFLFALSSISKRVNFKSF